MLLDKTSQLVVSGDGGDAHPCNACVCIQPSRAHTSGTRTCACPAEGAAHGAAHGVNATVWCNKGNLYAANALRIFDSPPWQLPSDAYLATRSADWKLPTAQLNFKTLTGAHAPGTASAVGPALSRLCAPLQGQAGLVSAAVQRCISSQRMLRVQIGLSPA